MTQPMHLRLVGTPALELADGEMRLLDRHGALITARLALAGPQERGLLAGLLWPDVASSRARANLRQRLLRLRDLAVGSWVVGDRVLSLAPEVRWAPPDQVDPPLADAQLRAELLEGVELPGAEALADWLAQMRAQRRTAQLRWLAEQMRQAQAEQRLDDALARVQQMLLIEPHAEEHHRALMQLHYLGHDTARAMSAYHHLRQVLAREFSAQPSAQTLALAQLLSSAARPAVLQMPVGSHAVALQRPPLLAGRQAELAQLRQATDQGGALLLWGEAGMGKSRLLAEATQGLADVLHVKAQAGDAGVPCALLARMLRRPALHTGLGDGMGGRPVAALVHLLPELAAGAPGPALPTDRLALCHAVEQALAQARLRLVVVDDIHFADEASLDMLTALVTSEQLPHLTWFFAQRPQDDPPAAARLRDTLGRAQRLRTVVLQALDEDAMAGLLRSLQLPGLDAPSWAPRLLRHTGGNPLFVLETLKQLPAWPDPRAALPQPLPVRTLIEQRLNRLSPAAIGLARVAAIAGPEFSAALAANVLQRPAIDLGDAWHELEQAQVLREAAFAHDLIQEAALCTIPSALARHLHACVAGWLETQAAEPARLAAHWQAAGLPIRALPWIERAADRARDQCRPGEEAAFLEQLVALVTMDQPARAVNILLRLAAAQVQARGFEAATAPLERALELAQDGPGRLQALNLLAEMQLNRLMPEASAHTARQAFDLARGLADTPAAAEAVLRWHRGLCLAGRAGQGEAVWQAQQHWMASVPWTNAECVSDRGWVLDRLGRPREARTWHQRALAMARAAQRPFDEAVVLGNLAQSLLLGGEPAAAVPVLDRADALSAHGQGLHDASDYMALYRGMAATALGHYAAALQHFDQALADTTQQSAAARHAVLAHRAMLWAQVGQRSRALTDAAMVIQQPHLPPWVTARAHHAMALTSAHAHDLADGLRQALHALSDPDQRALDAPVRLHLALLAAAPGVSRTDAAAPPALQAVRQILRHALRGGHEGLRWAAHWTAAQVALTSGQPRVAQRHALACASRPEGQAAPLLSDGAWWHGLWRVWHALGEASRADAARAAGLAWIDLTRQHHLPKAFHAGLCDQVQAHRELLSGRLESSG